MLLSDFKAQELGSIPTLLMSELVDFFNADIKINVYQQLV